MPATPAQSIKARLLAMIGLASLSQQRGSGVWCPGFRRHAKCSAPGSRFIRVHPVGTPWKSQDGRQYGVARDRSFRLVNTDPK